MNDLVDNLTTPWTVFEPQFLFLFFVEGRTQPDNYSRHVIIPHRNHPSMRHWTLPSQQLKSITMPCLTPNSTTDHLTLDITSVLTTSSVATHSGSSTIPVTIQDISCAAISQSLPALWLDTDHQPFNIMCVSVYHQWQLDSSQRASQYSQQLHCDWTQTTCPLISCVSQCTHQWQLTACFTIQSTASLW